MSAAATWREALGAWAIPPEILAQAPESPWIHPPALFDLPEVIEPSPSHERAREALPEGGSVLDVGCGGGIAAFALAPPARTVIGVDHQGAMLEMFARHAAERALTCQVVEGDWPDVASRTPAADVVTCHHVLYNVPDAVAFLAALDDHARSRVVIELPDRHPLAPMAPLWRHFWGLERPDAPTPVDLVAVLAEMGIAATREWWSAPQRPSGDLDQAAHFARIRLCLPAEREGEVRDFLAAHPGPDRRDLSTVWWDVTRA
jgi:SAM-dependent methyltransferase